jgi:hypothetical protein
MSRWTQVAAVLACCALFAACETDTPTTPTVDASACSAACDGTYNRCARACHVDDTICPEACTDAVADCTKRCG